MQKAKTVPVKFKFNIEKFKLAMRQKKTTARDIAKVIGVTEGMVGKYRSGENNPSIDYACRIARLLDLEKCDLIEEV